jgi:hypothetical protein
MDDQDDSSDTEFNGLLKGSKKLIRTSYKVSRPTRNFLAVSISLNILVVILSFVFWLGNKHNIRKSYEHGFTSDLGKEEDIRLKEDLRLIRRERICTI